jgi:hypothetical protein
MTNEDDPITLAEACGLYPRAKLTVSTLRSEAGRGRLEIFRLGRRDYTTPKAMHKMVQRCREDDPRRDCTSTQQDGNGSSGTDSVSSARAALNQTVTALKQGLPRISGKNTRRSVDHHR